jgi:hypothetical protein
VIHRKTYKGLEAVKSFCFVLFLPLVVNPVSASDLQQFQAGFGEVDITPHLTGKPVLLAGFGANRKATAVLDPLAVRAVVLRSGGKTIAIACADVVGLFLPSVERVRKELTGFDYVLVSSTHNHHGPDTMGLWGPNPFISGIDSDYLRRVESAIAQAVRDAEKSLQPVTGRIGAVNAPDLLHDSRPPIVKHDEMVVLEFRNAADKPAGVVVQWNCHPETIDSKSTRVSADFVGETVKELKRRYSCPVVYLTGTVGGLMTSINVDVRDEKGQSLPEGSVEKMHRYGQLLAAKASDAIRTAKPIGLTPFTIRSRSVALPVDNRRFALAQSLGVLDRPMERWTGDPRQEMMPLKDLGAERPAIRTEIACLGLGELSVAVIPGEIYPELVLGKVQDPADPAADFPDAPIEPSIYHSMPGPHKMIVGLGNDELGYILPKRQWDEKPPFTYGQKKAPYGEVNSLGPDAGPLICITFQDLLKETKIDATPRRKR